MRELKVLILLGIVTALVTTASAAVLYETSYTAGEGYNDAAQLAGAGQGWIWWGPAAPQYMVDTSSNGGSGFVTQDATAWSAAGVAQISAFADGWGISGVGQTGSYAPGDVIKITYDYQFSFSAAPTENAGCAKIGIDDDMADWNCVPGQGYYIYYITPANAGNTAGGVNFVAADYTTGALSLSADLLGIDASVSDFSSDNMRIVWEITNTDGTNWDLTDFQVTNLDTAATYTGATASTFAWTSDAFFGMVMCYNTLGTQSSVNESMKFEYTPVSFAKQLQVNITFDGIAENSNNIIYTDVNDVPLETPQLLAVSNYPVGGWAEPNSIAGDYDPANNNSIMNQWYWTTTEPNGYNPSGISFSGATRRDEAYFYTIFSDTGSNVPTGYVPNLNRGVVYLNYVQGNAVVSQDLHLLVRNGAGDWYLSSAATDDTQPAITPAMDITLDLSGLSWVQVESAAATEMNEMDADAGPGYLHTDPNYAKPETYPIDPNDATDLGIMEQATGIGIFLTDVQGGNDSFFRLRSMDITGYVDPVEVDEVSENFNNYPDQEGNVSFYTMYYGSATPVDEESPQANTNSGFRYGGWGDSTITSPETADLWSSIRFAQWEWDTDPEPEATALEFLDNAVDAGSYFYTIFSEIGNKNPTQYVTDFDLGILEITTWIHGGIIGNDVAAADLRVVVRDGDGNWYVSSIAFDDIQTGSWYKSYTASMSGLTWKAVNTAAQDDMNAMDGVDGGPGVLFDPGSPDVIPDLSQCTGIGLYIDSTTSYDINWLRIVDMKVKKGIEGGITSQVTETFSEFNGPGGSWISFWHAWHGATPDVRNDNEYTAINQNSNFRWGGHCDDLDFLAENWSAVMYDPTPEAFKFTGRAIQDGSYAYTIFSTYSDENANVWVDELTSVTIDLLQSTDQLANLRLIIREKDGDWLLSSTAVDNIPANTTNTSYTVNVADLTWENALQVAEDDMNELDGGPEPGGPGILVDPNTADPAIPDFVEISGGGIYLDEVGQPAAAELQITSITWNGLLSCGDPGLRELLADYTSDCYVNGDDLDVLAADWITTYVLDDFATLASEWMDCTEPTDALCDPF